MSAIHIGSVKIPFDDYVTQGTAVLGIRGAGKTHLAKSIAEQMLEAKVPIIVFDPIGVWRFLKIAADGGHGKPFKIVVAGGAQPDLPLTPASTPQIIRAALKENVPLVVDLYDPKLSKADWRRVVEQAFRIILYENKGLRHIFLEEASEYVGQRILPNQGAVFAEVEKMVRMGGNASVGITLINQRSQELNKSVLELCDNLVMMRQKGFHAIEYAEKWADRLSPETSKAIAAKLPKMEAGECWVFTDANDEPVFARSGALRSFHPDRKKPDHPKNAQIADTDEFVEKMSADLAKLIEEAKTNDPAELKRTVAELKRKLAQVEKATPAAEVERVEVPMLSKEQEKQIVEMRGVCSKAIIQCEAFLQECAPMVDKLREMNQRLADIQDGLEQQIRPAAQPKQLPVFVPRSVRERRVASGSTNGKLPIGERRVLEALIQYPNGLAREQLTVLSGYKRSSRDAYIQRLREKGYAGQEGDLIVATQEGCAALPDAQPLPTGEELRDYWVARLPLGERAVLEQLMAAYPKSLSRESLDEVTGYKRSSRDAYIARLRAKELVSEAGRGEVRASEHLFD